MPDKATSRLGGVCAMLAGCLSIGYAIAFILQPALPKGDLPVPPFMALRTGPLPFGLLHMAAALGALCALGAVAAISDLVRHRGEGWLRWSSLLAGAGMLVAAVDALRYLALAPLYARQFAAGDAVLRATAVLGWATLSLDPQGYVRLGGVAFWVAVVSLAGRRSGELGPALGIVGLAYALCLGLWIVGLVYGSDNLVTGAIGLGAGVFAPIWYLALGSKLWLAEPVQA